MKKILAFYPVTNSATADRNHFDSMNPEEAYSVLKSMPEARLYDLTRNDRTGQMLDMQDFVEDYNDEIFDGGWWSVIIVLNTP